MVVKPVTLLMGGETALRDEAIRAVRSAIFSDPSQGEMNTHHFLAGSDPLSEVLTLAQTAPFLASKRLIILKETEDLSDKEREDLLARIRNNMASTVWIIASTATKPKNAFLTRLSEIARVITCQAPYKDSDVTSWLRKKAVEKGKAIDVEAAALLLEMTGRDLALLESRLEQLLLLARTRETVSITEVRAVCGDSAHESAFNLYEALRSGRFETAYKSLKRLFGEGGKPHEVVGALIWRFDRNLKIRNMLDAGMRAPDIGQALNINRFFLEQEIEQARGLSAQKAEGHLRVLYDCDAQLKRGTLDAQMAVERCLLGLNEIETLGKS